MSFIYSYRIDASDRLEYVSPEWLQFAQENDAPELTESFVLGEDIWRFIADRRVRELYRTLFHSLRGDRKEAVIPFRCDSPGKVRNMDLQMRSAPGGGIEFAGRLISEKERSPVSLFSRRLRRTREAVRICSFCRRLQLGGNWLAPEIAVVQKRWFGGRPIPQLNQSLCQDCLDSASQA